VTPVVAQDAPSHNLRSQPASLCHVQRTLVAKWGRPGEGPIHQAWVGRHSIAHRPSEYGAKTTPGWTPCAPRAPHASLTSLHSRSQHLIRPWLARAPHARLQPSHVRLQPRRLPLGCLQIRCSVRGGLVPEKTAPNS